MELEDVIKEASERSGNNVAIFIDYDNIYHSMRNLAINIEDEEYNIIKLLWKCYGRDRVRSIKAYADFDQIHVKLRDLQLDRIQIRQVYGNGQGETNRKNASDIELSIDAMESVVTKNDIDTYVFVTADSDMIPIMSRMIFKGKKVHLFYTGLNVSQYQDITNYAHFYNDIVQTFNIDLNRRNPSYWKESVISYINEWYAFSKNKGKALGAKWLNGGLVEKYCMSPILASNCISYLENEAQIIKVKLGSNEGFIDEDKWSEFQQTYGAVRI